MKESRMAGLGFFFRSAQIGCLGLISAAVLMASAGVVKGQDYQYITNADNTITITRYTGTNIVVIIPNRISNLRVSSIGVAAFQNCTVTDVTIPDSVTNIVEQAFMDCYSLTNVTIGNGVTSIGDDAFELCTNLTNVIIGNSVTTIGQYAFDSCPLTGSLIIPDSVSNIGFCAFEFCQNLTSVTIGNGVTNIGDDAFDGCTSLTNVIIGNSVTNIGYDGFGGCTSLTNVTIGNCVTSIGSFAFAGCPLTGGVTIPYNVTTIGEMAFTDCRFTNITFPSSVTYIGDLAFANCHSLTAFYFKGNAPSTGPDGIQNNYQMTVYYLSGTTGWGTMFSGCPTVLWNPQIGSTNFGMRSNQFGFTITITGTNHLVVLIEACTDMINSFWYPIQTSTITNASTFFSDPNWTNYPRRFYRLSMP